MTTSVAQTGTLSQTISLAYNSDFLVKTLTYAGAANAYTFDNDNLLTGSGGYAIARNSQNGLPTSVTGNGLTESRTFNQYGELDAWTVAVGGSTAADYALTRDAAGNIASRTETVAGVTHTYAYTCDNVGRLTQVTRDGAVVESYAYAGPGTGRTAETNALRGLTSRAYAYDAEDHLAAAGDASFSYDADGFLASKAVAGQTTSYRYSSRGELKRVDLPSGDVVAYTHDPLGRRIAKTLNGTVVEKYLWQGRTRLLAVYDGNGSLKQRFEYADGRMPVAMTVGGTRYFLVYDQVDSLRAVTDASGGVVKTVEYDSFGNVIADSNAAFKLPFGFAGGLYDADTGLTRFGFRDYDADVGRWTAKDPIGFEGGDADLYGYVVGDPVKLIDANGLIYTDKTYGFPKAFWKWYHKGPDGKQSGDQDLSKGEAKDLFDEWQRQNMPGPDHKKDRKRDNPCPSDEQPEEPKEQTEEPANNPLKRSLEQFKRQLDSAPPPIVIPMPGFVPIPVPIIP